MGNKEKNMTILNITNAENNADVLSALSGDEPVNVRTAMQIPMVSRCVNMIAGAVAMLPIKLYRRTGDGVEEIKEDRRLDILNRDTGDTICADYMRYAWVRDLLLTGAAYAYIERRGTDFLPYRLYYVASEEISRDVNRTDPIKKIYRYNIGGRTAEPWEMLKILRNTDGYGGGKGILEENPEMIATAYGLIKYQKKQVSSGGAKRGILRTNGLKKDVVEEIKEKWAALWGAKNDRDTMFILNSKDSDFKELSSTSVDMQLNQTQETIDKELMKLFGTNDGMLTEETVKNAVLPVIDIIEAALDTDLLYEREKRDCYFAFDTRELTRGDINQRYNAYATALSQNFMQLDEVRAMEDLPPLGINFVKLGLNDVLLDPKTGQIYTPNTNAYAQMGKNVQVPLTDEVESGTIESRSNPNHVPAGSEKGGQFAPAISAYGTNTFIVRDFKSKAKANNHFQKHNKEFAEDGITDTKTYLEKSLELLESNCDDKNILGFLYPDGRLARYDVKKEYFAVGNPYRGIYSMFKAKEGKAYFDVEYAKRDKSQEV